MRLLSLYESYYQLSIDVIHAQISIKYAASSVDQLYLYLKWYETEPFGNCSVDIRKEKKKTFFLKLIKIQN